MKNREKYIYDIIDMACSNSNVAISKKGLAECESIKCSECLLSKIRDNELDNCNDAFKYWCEQEYIPFNVDDLIEVRKPDGTISIAKCIAVSPSTTTFDLNFNSSYEAKIGYIPTSYCRKYAETLKEEE